MKLVDSSDVQDGFDPKTGVPKESLRWAIEALFTKRPTAEQPFEELAHWLNALAGLANAYVRAGGSMQDLQHLETSDPNFFWGSPVTPR